MDSEKKYDRILPERGRDPERDKLMDLYKPLASEFHEAAVFEYIKYRTQIAPEVVSGWLNGTSFPSEDFRKRIINCLNDYQRGDIPEPKKIPKPAKKAVNPKSKIPAVAKKKISPQEQKRKDTIKQNEEMLEALLKKLKDEGKIP